MICGLFENEKMDTKELGEKLDAATGRSGSKDHLDFILGAKTNQAALKLAAAITLAGAARKLKPSLKNRKAPKAKKARRKVTQSARRKNRK